MSQHKVVLLLGSNLGDTNKNLESAIQHLEEIDSTILLKSSTLISEAVEFASCNNFRNIATLISTHFSPIKLLNKIKEIEAKMGRKMDSSSIGHYTDRIIDIDIVKYDHVHFESKRLTIPHRKNLFERAFSMKLLQEIEIKQQT